MRKYFLQDKKPLSIQGSSEAMAIGSCNQHNDFTLTYKTPKGKRIAIIGGGWSGAHIASSLAKKGHNVTLFEANPQIFSGISGSFGIRLHVGPHYPRSYATRKACHYGICQFRQTYPELVYEHDWSIYAIGKTDVEGKPSKISTEQFRAVCNEFELKGEVEPESIGLNPDEIDAAFDLNEPSGLLGPQLRGYFEKLLIDQDVNIRCNFKVVGLEKKRGGIYVTNGSETQKFEHVINTTSFQSLLPSRIPLPFNMNVVYQPLLALHYQDSRPGSKPISFITMDGLFPCIMPVVTRLSGPVDEYIMTHAKFTTVGSYSSADEASAAYSQIDDIFINKHVRKPSEAHMERLWPAFSSRFRYTGWSGTVMAKIRTNGEFRASVSFQDPENDVIYVFPGKITNVFDAESEVMKLMSGVGIKSTREGYKYVKDGLLDEAREEIVEEIIDVTRNTGHLQTHRKTLLVRKRREETSIDFTNNTEPFKGEELSSFFEYDPPSCREKMTEHATLSAKKLGKLAIITGIVFLGSRMVSTDRTHSSSLFFVAIISVIFYIISELPPVKRKIEKVQNFSFFKCTPYNNPVCENDINQIAIKTLSV